MKNNTIIIAVMAVALLLGIGIGFAVKPSETVRVKEVVTAEGDVVPGIMIGVVDDALVIEKAKAYAMLRKEYEKQMEALKGKSEKEKERLKKENDSIAKKRSTLSQEEFDREVEKFAKDQTDTVRRLSEEGKKLEQAYMDAMNKIRADSVDSILRDIAKEKGLGIILSKMVTLLYDNGLDVTDDVIQRLDKKQSKASLGL